MTKQDGNEKANRAEERAQIADAFAELEGPQLRIGLSKADSLQGMVMAYEHDFPPFIVIVYEGDGSAQFRMQYHDASPQMRAAALLRLKTMTEMDDAAAVIQQRKKQASGQILVAGDGFDPKNFGPQDGKP